MKNIIKVISTITIIFTLNTLSFSDNKKTTNILVLNSYHIGLSWTQEIVKGVKSILTEDIIQEYNLKIDYEYMDTKRFSGDKFYETLTEILKHKASKIKYDIILSADDNALNFLLKKRNQIFGEIPVIFCGINSFSDKILINKKNYTGVLENFSIKSTLDIALKLHPETKKFIIIGDQTMTSKMDRIAFKKIIPEYKKLEFEFLKHANIIKYQRYLKGLKKGNVAIAMHVNKDNRGKFYSFEESFKIYTLSINIPVYTFWDFYLGIGSIGGMIVSGFDQGTVAAEQVLEIIKGKKIKNIPIIKTSPNKYIFDYNILKKFKINQSLLPSSTIIINRPKNLSDIYQEYKSIIHKILLFISFLIIIIFILIFNIQKRKRLEKQLIDTNLSYNRFVPHSFLKHLHKNNIIDVKLGDFISENMTLLFSDIRSFTTISEKMSPEENFNFLNTYLKQVSPIIRDNNGFIDKYIGDAIMALFTGKTEDAIITSIEMQKQVIEFNLRREENKEEPIFIGVGLHTSDLLLGTVGEKERMDGTIISDAVDLVSWLEGANKDFGTNIIFTEETLKGLGKRSSKYIYRFLGKVSVQNKKLKLYELLEGNINSTAELKIKTKTLFEKGLSLFYSKNFEKASKYFENVLKLNPEDKSAKMYFNKNDEYIKTGVSDDWDGYEIL